MKICTNCGATYDDSRFFCVKCGTKLGEPVEPTGQEDTTLLQAPAAPQESYASAGSDGAGYGQYNPQPQYAQYNQYTYNNPEPVKKAKREKPRREPKNISGVDATKAKAALAREGGSKLMLFTAILLSLAIVLSIFGAFAFSNSINSVIAKAERIVVDVARNDLGEDVTLQEVQNLVNEAMDEAGVDLSAGSSAVTVSAGGNIFAILIALAFWLMWGSSRKGETGVAGIVIIKIIAILRLVACCLLLVAVIGGSVYGTSLLRELMAENDLHTLMTYSAPVVRSVIIVMVVAVMIDVVFHCVVLRNLNSIKAIIKTNVYNGKFGMLPGIMLLMNSGRTILMSLYMAIIYAAVLPIALPSLLAGLFTTCAYAFIGASVLRMTGRLKEAA